MLHTRLGRWSINNTKETNKLAQQYDLRHSRGRSEVFASVTCCASSKNCIYISSDPRIYHNTIPSDTYPNTLTYIITLPCAQMSALTTTYPTYLLPLLRSSGSFDFHLNSNPRLYHDCNHDNHDYPGEWCSILRSMGSFRRSSNVLPRE